MLYFLLCRATYLLTDAHTNSFGLSSQWATGKRNTVCPLSRAASSVKYSGSGLFCLTFRSNVRFIQNVFHVVVTSPLFHPSCLLSLVVCLSVCCDMLHCQVQ